MPGNLQTLRRRIRSVSSTRKITKAQELVAASRIGRAQQRVEAARPYAEAIGDVLVALAGRARLDHPLLVPRTAVRNAGLFFVTSDRGLCGGYNANVLRETEAVSARLIGEGRRVVRYAVGRKGVTYYTFRNRDLAGNWTGFSERPTAEHAREIGQALLGDFLAGSARGGIDELYLIYTRFKTLMTQTPVTLRLAPVELPSAPLDSLVSGLDQRVAPVGGYEFEPAPDELLSSLLPKYVETQIYTALLDAAASESASRRRAMKSATDNADDLITAYTRQMNSARQAAITQEISEIVGGANALAAGRDV